MTRYIQWFLALVFVLGFYVWQQTQSVRLGYAVDGLQKECERWERENEVWRLKVNKYLSLEKLDMVAKEKALVRPGEKDIIYLSQ